MRRDSATRLTCSVDDHNMFANKLMFRDENIVLSYRSISLIGFCVHATAALGFLSETIPAYGGKVFVRRIDSADKGEIEFDFCRALCVEMYIVLAASQIVLDHNSELLLNSLCQCTQELLAQVGDERIVVKLCLSPAGNNVGASQPSPKIFSAQ